MQREEKRRAELPLGQVERHKALQRAVALTPLVGQRRVEQLLRKGAGTDRRARHRLAVRTQRTDRVVRQHRETAHEHEQRTDHLGAQERRLGAARTLRRDALEHELHALDRRIVARLVVVQLGGVDERHEPRRQKRRRGQAERLALNEQAQLVQHTQRHLVGGLERKVERHERGVRAAQPQAQHERRDAFRTRLAGARKCTECRRSHFAELQRLRTLRKEHTVHGTHKGVHVRTHLGTRRRNAPRRT